MRPAPPRTGPPARVGDEGELTVFVADEQDDHPVDVGRWQELARNALTAEGVRGDAELAVLYVDETAMAELNHRFMGKNGPTDVLAFPIEDDEAVTGRVPDGSTSGPDRDALDEVPLLLGDVVICPAVAARNAPNHAGTYEDELALLLVHGILHVLGHDHAEPEEAAAMQRRERDLLDRFAR